MWFSDTQCPPVGEIQGGNSYVCVTFPVEFDLKQAKKKATGGLLCPYIICGPYTEPGELKWEKGSKKKKIKEDGNQGIQQEGRSE